MFNIFVFVEMATTKKKLLSPNNALNSVRVVLTLRVNVLAKIVQLYSNVIHPALPADASTL